MAKRKRELWEDEFEDISSFSSGVRPPARDPFPERPKPRETSRPRPVREPVRDRRGRPAEPHRTPSERRRRREPEWDLPQWETSSRPRRPGGTGPDRRPSRSGRSQPPPPRKRAKKPMSQGARRAAACFAILVMSAATVLLAVFLLFKVTDIRITGDAADKYQRADILSACGCKTGDNLVFLAAGSKERALKERLPYVGEAQMIRHFPNTLEIRLTAVQACACVYDGAGWLCVSSKGKVLERRDEPQEGLMQVYGLSLPELKPGETMELSEPKAPKEADVSSGDSKEAAEYREALQAYNALRAYLDIAAELAELEAASDFTYLALSDLSDIRLYYQNRIEFRLGNVLELPYKIDLGLRSAAEWEAQNPGLQAQGVMDLTEAGDTKTAVFTEGTVEPPAGQPAGGAPADGALTPSPSPGPDSGASAGSSEVSSSESPRTQGIPDTAYTGEPVSGEGDGARTEGGDGVE